MIELLKRPEGATVEQIAAATGWQHHTIRGAISGALKKKLGLTVEATRTREVGPNKTGAKGSSTVYRIVASQTDPPAKTTAAAASRPAAISLRWRWQLKTPCSPLVHSCAPGSSSSRTARSAGARTSSGADLGRAVLLSSCRAS